MASQVINVLFVEDNVETVKLVEAYLQRFEGAEFRLIWKDGGASAIEELKRNKDIDIILMDYFLPGRNGLEVMRELTEKNITVPVVFLTVNRDMNLAVEVMKLGAEDYLIKDDIMSPVFPQTILGVVGKRRLKKEVSELEIKKRRLEAMQELIVGITNEITEPLTAMKDIVSTLMSRPMPEKAEKYLSLIKDNVDRIESKMDKLKNLKEDKTVQYIKDIKMIDLS